MKELNKLYDVKENNTNLTIDDTKGESV